MVYMLDFTIKNEGNVHTGYLVGRLDAESSPKFAKTAKPLLSCASETIIMDCSKLEYISSSGLRELLLIRKKVAERNGKFTLTNVSYYIRSVLAMTGMLSLFEIRN